MAIRYRGNNTQEDKNVSVRLEPVIGYDYTAYDTSSGEGIVETTTYWLVPDGFEYSSSIEFDKDGGGFYSASYFLVKPMSITGSFYGDFNGTASYTSTASVAISASYAPVSIDTSSFYVSSSLFANALLFLYRSDLSFDYVNLTELSVATASYALNAATASSVNGATINNTAWTSYTPVWTAASVNPVIGNGTITGQYKVIGKTCFVRGNVAMGSTTTFGTGEWYISMPFTASHADAILMTANLLDNGTAWYNATVNGARAGFNYKAAIQYQAVGGTANDINATQPFTWANSDRFLWNGSFEIA
jgi:hypothetical protein